MKRDDARAARPFDPTVSVPALLNTLNNRLSSGASDLYLRHFGVGINEWRILTVLRSTSGCTAAFIAARAAIHLTVISRGLRSLQGKGLVDIDRSAWQRLATLTADGRALHDRVAAVALARERCLLQGLSDAEVDTLRGLLGRLTANVAAVDAYVPEGGAASS